MILNQNQSNNVILTLSESVSYTGSPVYFLFHLYNLTTHEEKLFTSPDLSTNIVRFNKFNWILTGSTSENLTGGTINIQPDGELYLDVYQMSNPTNLAISGTTGIVIENQLVQVKGTQLDRITYSYSGTPSTYLGYEG
jgi:hypothetical protein